MGPDAVAILLGAGHATRSNDTQFPFRQDSDLLYLTGFAHPNAAAVLRTDEGQPAFTLYVEPREREAETWNGYRPGIEGALQDFGANAALPRADLLGSIPKLLENKRRLYHVLGRDAEVDAKIIESIDGMRMRSRLGVQPPSTIVDPRSLVHEMRLLKDPHEIAVMRRAAQITREGHHAAARMARDGVMEFELEAALDGTFRRLGASGPAYTTIVGGGRNATILHYVTNDQPLHEGDLVLIDAGCELAGYASDVTRTYPVGGRFEGAARDVYELVLAAQHAALDGSKPGATLDDVHTAAVRVLTDGMVRLGLLHGTVDGLIESGAHRAYYMHRTSHWLGLDVHDVGSYSVDGNPRALEPGIVLTVEPGLYVPIDAENVDPRFRGIGVRIEDDVLVTADGHEILTADIPKHPDAVESWMREA